MGLLIDGKWSDRWYDTSSTGGRFVRQDAEFRDWVTADGSSGFPVESGRYHLYVSLACPWAHRTLITRKLKGLESHIGVTVVHPHMLDHGWEFKPPFEDNLGGRRYFYELYQQARPGYTGRVTVPILWDTHRNTIVNNESAEILRMFDAEFAALGAHGPTLYPEALRSEIDAVNEWVYSDVNNGVYKAGFATTQKAYDEAVNALFTALDRLEKRLEGRDFLVGDTLTEADIRLFTTLIRFDPVYAGHFKCDRRRIVDYPNLWRLTRRLYQWPGVADTIDIAHIREHYYYSHESINPHRIVSTGPVLDYTAPLD